MSSITVEWGNHKFSVETFVRKNCYDCPCGGAGTCKSACLGGDVLPLAKAAERLYKPSYTRRINKKTQTLRLKVVGFYCEGREMANLTAPKEKPDMVLAGWMIGESGR